MMRFLPLLAILLASCGQPVAAHQAMSGWQYPMSCCADNDCAQIAPETVRETARGYVITIQPGTHPMWKADRGGPLIVSVPYAQARVAPDGRWHICLDHTGKVLCFFASAGGS